jgi:hypothetical protein
MLPGICGPKWENTNIQNPNSKPCPHENGENQNNKIKNFMTIARSPSAEG